MEAPLDRIAQALRVLQEAQHELVDSSAAWMELRAKHAVLEVNIGFGAQVGGFATSHALTR